jgi:hypothetical protein
MEFLLYLTPVGNQIVNNLVSSKVNIYENSGRCQVERIFGHFSSNSLTICTNNIKEMGYNPYHYVNETLYHEAVHAAQSCRSKKYFGFTKTLGISRQNMPLSYKKESEVKRSVAANGNIFSSGKEHEAYYLEDKPEQVLKYVKKFCF